MERKQTLPQWVRDFQPSFALQLSFTLIFQGTCKTLVSLAQQDTALRKQLCVSSRERTNTLHFTFANYASPFDRDCVSAQQVRSRTSIDCTHTMHCSIKHVPRRAHSSQDWRKEREGGTLSFPHITRERKERERERTLYVTYRSAFPVRSTLVLSLGLWSRIFSLFFQLARIERREKSRVFCSLTYCCCVLRCVRSSSSSSSVCRCSWSGLRRQLAL